MRGEVLVVRDHACASVRSLPILGVQVRVFRRALGPAHLALVARAADRAIVAVHDQVPPGDVMAVVRHALDPDHRTEDDVSGCSVADCGLAVEWHRNWSLARAVNA